jgi:hypothetical protein
MRRMHRWLHYQANLEAPPKKVQVLDENLSILTVYTTIMMMMKPAPDPYRDTAGSRSLWYIIARVITYIIYL